MRYIQHAILFFFCCCAAAFSHAQTAFSYGIDGGVHSNKLNNQNDKLSLTSLNLVDRKLFFPNYKQQHLIGYNGMLSIQLPSPGHFSLATGLGYTRINHQIGEYDTSYYYLLGVGTTHLDYLDLPVMLCYTHNLDFGDTRRFNLRFGPEFSYLINYSYKAVYKQQENNPDFLDVYLNNKNAYRYLYSDTALRKFSAIDTLNQAPYTKLLVSLRAELNFQFDLDESDYVSIGCYGQWGLMDVEDKTTTIHANGVNPDANYYNSYAGKNRLFPAAGTSGSRAKTSLVVYALQVGFHHKF